MVMIHRADHGDQVGNARGLAAMVLELHIETDCPAVVCGGAEHLYG